MRTYYRLEEDLYIKGRWQLKGPVDDKHRNENEFWQARHIQLRGKLIAEIHIPGKALDFSQTVSVVPVLSKRLSDVVRILDHRQFQLFPVEIPGHHGFEVLNICEAVHCVDEKRSDFLKWTKNDGRPDKLGDYRMITKLRLDPNKIPPDLHIFRIAGWKIAIVVSQNFVDAISPLKPTGMHLELAV